MLKLLNYLLSHTALRRSVVISLVFIVTGLVFSVLPLLLLAAAFLSLHPRFRSLPRFIVFISGILLFEVMGIFACFWVWLRNDFGHGDNFAQANYALQNWWASSLIATGKFAYSLTFDFQGVHFLSAEQDKAAIMLPRHSSIGDTPLPIVAYAMPLNFCIRYVLKRELLLEPCLDIVGNRVPNHFLHRSSANMGAEVAALQSLFNDIPDNHGIVMYPEGTRFTAPKREQLIQKLEQKGNSKLAERAKQWTHLLPPKANGLLALLEKNPGRDLVFMAQTGFEEITSLRSFIDGTWTNTAIRIRFWKVNYSDIPATAEQQTEMLYQQWDKMNDAVEELLALEKS